jgi:hypothetical protein
MTTTGPAVFEIHCNATEYRQGKATECGRLICRNASISEAVRVAKEVAKATCDDETGKWKCNSCQNINWWKGKTRTLEDYLIENGEL